MQGREELELAGLPRERPGVAGRIAARGPLVRLPQGGAGLADADLSSRHPQQPEIPLIVGAMGAQALRVAGELADGTMPFLAGPRTLEEHIVPRITEAAARAGRPAPRVIASVPAIVTDDIDQARAAATAHLAFYDSIPSYRRVRDMEGAHRAVDLALIGDEATVAAGLRRYMEAGATEITVAYTDIAREEDRRRTWQLAGELTRSA